MITCTLNCLQDNKVLISVGIILAAAIAALVATQEKKEAPAAPAKKKWF